MPRHILDDFGRIEVETSPAPSHLGEGEAFAEFWDGMDLAIGSVGQEAARQGCTRSMDDITQTRVVAGQVLRGDLRFVEEGGAVTQYPMRIVDTIDHKSFVAEFEDPDAQSFQGLSGGYMFAQGLPIGMAIQSPDGARQMTFIRIEEIAFAAERWLEGRARAVTLKDRFTTKDSLSGAQAIPMTLSAYDAPPISPQFSPGGLSRGTGPYIFEYSGPTTISFELSSERALPVRRVRIVSDGDEAKPLRLRVFVDAGDVTRPNPLVFARGQMDPGGLFDTDLRAERLARRVTIAIDTVQGRGPVRIDRIEVY